ncbi:MAG: HEAT repeat domain-containing protein [Vicinamibacterales bacterium]
MLALAERLRDWLIPLLLLLGGAVALLLVVVIAQRVARDWRASRHARDRARYAPLLRDALEGDQASQARAMTALGRAARRHRAVVADALVEPLRVVRGNTVDRARMVARDLGLLAGWRTSLARGSWAVRSRAALALGLVRDAEAVPALVVLLDDASDQVRAAAADALGMIGDTAAIEALLGRLGQQSRHQQARLVEALRRIGPPVTKAIVGRGAANAEERILLAEVLAMVGGPGARATLLEWTSDEDARVRAGAWRAIGAIGVGDRAAYHALRALGDADPRVRAHAAQALGRTGRADVVPYLAAHLDDEWEVAAQGARALAWLGRPGVLALRAREASGLGGHGLELARHFLWEHERP